MVLVILVLPLAFFALALGLERVERWAGDDRGATEDVAGQSRR